MTSTAERPAAQHDSVPLREPVEPSSTLLQLYGASAEEHAALEELRREASQRGWWSTARLPEWLAAYVGLEADATSLRCLALELIPGLLQTRTTLAKPTCWLST
ncbi:MAG: hypothetical protein ACRDTA_14625 [Pseudonocardiaceae bacterium]